MKSHLTTSLLIISCHQLNKSPSKELPHEQLNCISSPMGLNFIIAMGRQLYFQWLTFCGRRITSDRRFTTRLCQRHRQTTSNSLYTSFDSINDGLVFISHQCIGIDVSVCDCQRIYDLKLLDRIFCEYLYFPIQPVRQWPSVLSFKLIQQHQDKYPTKNAVQLYKAASQS